MKRIILPMAFGFLLLQTASLWSVTAEQAQREVLVYVKTDTTIIIPPPSISASVQQTTINYQPLRDTLTNYAVEVIEKADPYFNRADTIAYDSAGNPIKLLDLSRLFRIRLVSGGNASALKQALDSMRGDVVYSEINGTAQYFEIVPNDNLFYRQWGLKNTGQAGGTAGEDIKAAAAWEIFQGSSGIKIAIMDGGIDPNHPEFAGRIQSAESYYPGDPAFFHGTHVAGIAAASANNNGNRGVAGVDWNAKIIAKNIATFDNVEIYNKTRAAVNEGAHVLNHSWGGPDYSLTVRSAFSYAYRVNRVSVVSMGNSSDERAFFPAAFGQGITAVGALQNTGNYSTFSTQGNHIDVSAPGGINPYPGTNDQDILSTFPRYFGRVSDGAELSYDNVAGTSMSAPFVTGLSSLLIGFRPSYSNDDIENIIKLSADDRDDRFDPPLPAGWDKFTGYGLINAERALKLLQVPYVLQRISGGTGGTDVASVGPYTTIMWDVPGLAPGTYYVRRHEIRRTVTFPQPFYTGASPLSTSLYPWPAAWGRGNGSVGFSPESPNVGLPFSEVVPGTITNTGCQLRTYIYEVWDLAGNFLGWTPTTAPNVSFQYTVLGEPLLTAPSASVTYPHVVLASGWTVRVKLDFPENNINEEGMAVERKDATNNIWGVVATLPPNTTTWTDMSDLMGSQTYTYRIKAFTRNQTVYSNEVTVRTRPKPGVNFKAAVGSVTTYCINEGMGGGASEIETAEGGGIELLGPPGYCTYKTNKVVLTWNAPSNQNPAVPIVNYRVDAYWLKNRSAMCPCWGCFPVTQLWETYEQSVISTSTSAIICTQQQDTLYSFYITAFDAAGDSSLLWIKQTCPPDSKLVIQPAYAYPGGFCVSPCCGLGKATASTGQAGSSALPTEFALGPNFPNPFNPTTTIRYALPQGAKVELRIYNILGQVVRKLADEEKPAGYHQTLWDGKDEAGRPVSSGIYLYQIKAGDFIETKKMQLIK
ncbi:MAG TPA: S8 family serine peptidase [Verrucomicrobiae bacterium]|nr:S8 family serine peptidase [Verrucomicrobiae bacterium]